MAGAVIVSKLAADADAVRLAVSTSSRLTNLIYSDPEATDDRVVRNEITGLDPDTEYWYTLEIDGALRISNIGRFKTKPDGPSSFKIAFASCAETDSEHPVFDYIRSFDPLFFIHMGDLHYRDIAVNDTALFEAGYDGVLASRTQSRFFRRVPVQYMWDDHDYGPNNSGASSPSREASRISYRRRVPHPPLELSSGAIHHSFVVGRMRFIMTDLRSERSDTSDPDDASKTMMGSAQKQWFKDELLAAKAAGQFIMWISTVPWHTDIVPESWGGFTTERTELAEFIRDEGLIGRIAMICADRHAIGIDDGTNTDYADDEGFPLFMAAPLDKNNAPMQHAPFSEGYHDTNRNQFGFMEVTDTGGSTITIDWRGYGYGEGELIHYQFAADLAA